MMGLLSGRWRVIALRLAIFVSVLVHVVVGIYAWSRDRVSAYLYSTKKPAVIRTQGQQLNGKTGMSEQVLAHWK